MIKLTIDDFIKRSKKIHNDKFDYSLVNYKNSKTKIKIICPIHGIFEQVPFSHLNGSGCSSCNGGIKITKMDFINKSNLKHNNKYDYSLVNYKNSKNKVIIICPHHGKFKQISNDHLNGSGCPICVGKNKNTKTFINDAIKIHGDKYDYSLVDYKNPHSKEYIICSIHGKFKMSYNQHITKKHNCPNCNSSSGESMIRKILIDNNIVFDEQKTFENCKYKKQLKFDFYLPHNNLCIEYDGRHHFMNTWGDYDVIQIRDNIKNEYCKNNNINLLRIKYNENIFNKLKKIKKL